MGGGIGSGVCTQVGVTKSMGVYREEAKCPLLTRMNRAVVIVINSDNE